MFKKCFVLVMFGFISRIALSAPTLSYELFQIDGTQWQYNYTLFNDSEFIIEEFSVWFDYNLYSELQLQSTPDVSAEWDEWISQPNSDFAANGLYDPFALTGNEVQPGETISGFAVSFNWLGSGSPSSQPFDIIDPTNYSVPLFSGETILDTPHVIPVPSAGLLATFGIATVFSYIRKRRS